jgi:mannosyltransferase OCH1-like enzyme
MSIPKKIHYCWLSGDEIPAETVKCINTWKKIMPEYELVLWDKNKFDIKSVPFVEEACKVKKWAFAADFIRLYAIYNEGGIYMDTDV